MKATIVFMFVIALGLAWAGQVNAQEEHYGNRPWELNVNAGAHFLDTGDTGAESDTDVGVGGRIFMNMPSGLGFGGSFTYVISDADFDGTDIDINTYLYSAELAYTFGSGNRLHPFITAGVGAATTKLSDADGLGLDEDSETNLLIPIGGGIKWFGSSGSWAIRAEVRDNIVSSGDQEFGFDVDSETFHNIEVSGGISFLFGGGM